MTSLKTIQTLIASVNLIGDTLTQVPAIHRYMREHPDEEVTWLLHSNPSTVLFWHCGIPVHYVRGEDPGDSSPVSEMRDIPGKAFHKKILLQCRQAWNLSLNRNEHICQGYARCLGVRLETRECLPHLSVAPNTGVLHEKVLPFSIRSASNDPRDGDGFSGNKNFPVKGWIELLKPFIARGYKPVQLLGPEDTVEVPGFESKRMGIVDVAAYISGCGIYAGVDNGITHIAAAVGANCFVIYPGCLPLTWVGYQWTGRYHAAQQHAYHGDVDRVLRVWTKHL